MAEMSFDDAIEWLSGKAGESVYVEIGTKDPTVEIDAVTAPLAMHVTLAGIESASETSKDRLMVLIRLPELTESRFYLDPASVTKVEGVPGTFRLWFHDASTSASPAKADSPSRQRSIGAVDQPDRQQPPGELVSAVHRSQNVEEPGVDSPTQRPDSLAVDLQMRIQRPAAGRRAVRPA